METEQKLDYALKEQEKVALDLNKISIPYNVLAREVASDQSTYDAVMLRLRETTVTQSLNRTPFRIVEQPRVAKEPIKPNRIKTMFWPSPFSRRGIGAIALDSIDPSFRSLDEREAAQSAGDRGDP
jgi:hypothetical protein